MYGEFYMLRILSNTFQQFRPERRGVCLATCLCPVSLPLFCCGVREIDSRVRGVHGSWRFGEYSARLGSCADHELAAFPGYVFFDGQRRVAELFAKFLDGSFFRLRISPRSITTSCSYVFPSIERAE